MQKCPRTAQPDAAALVEVKNSKTVLSCAVEIVVALMAGLDSRLNEGVRERIVFAGFLYVEFSAGTVKIRYFTEVILVALVVGEDILVVPPLISERAPFVIVRRVASHVDRAVDGGATSEQLAARAGDLAAVDLRAAAIDVLPVVAGVRQQENVADRQRRFHVDREMQIGRAGFDQGHACGWIFRKTVCEQTTGGAGPDHDEIKVLPVLGNHGICSLVISFSLPLQKLSPGFGSGTPVAPLKARVSMVVPLQ